MKIENLYKIDAHLTMQSSISANTMRTHAYNVKLILFITLIFNLILSWVNQDMNEYQDMH